MNETTPPQKDDRIEQFAALLATCQRRVFLYVLGLMPQAADAEEIVQETNLVLWRKFDEFEPDTNFAAWACRIAHFEVLKFREKQSRQHRLFRPATVEALAVEMAEAVDGADTRREALSGCLGKLAQRDRLLITQRYQPGASTRSVAETLARSVQGVRKSLHRIRTALLACIERTLAAENRP